MKMFTRHGNNMAYLDIGSGPALLFGHGFLLNSAVWASQIDVLSQHYRCIVPDFWAHGQSAPMPDETKTLVDYADDMLALMDHLDIETFGVVGHSVGGVWGAEIALKAPTRVKTLVMLNAFLGYEPEVTKAKYFGMLDTIVSAQHVPVDVIDAFANLFFSVNAETECVDDFRQVLGRLDGDRAQDIAKVGRIVFERRDTFDDAELLTLPTLILAGTEDKIRSPLESMLMHDGIDGSEYVLIPNAGHMSNVEQADMVTRALSSFLSKQTLI
ncbi:alpha/beta hydrolase [Enterovibrio sp. ZSDZ35]|uniref:Alpha/beta hydrolase n=1 Tax=Enterovibrio qingdaonensis TaxID=2899818 RepID=A0ABT5QFL7_9GAMM|nr:alpha/beta hydrolase [Enterovibrio sp. ZSDZ35]MDD1779772.1 alpha/beta hydrolase [Enterovibrio sp. ZSDZ35]